MISNARTFYCNTHNFGVLQTYHLLCSNTCQRRSDHVQLVTTGLYPNMRVRKYSDSPALIFFKLWQLSVNLLQICRFWAVDCTKNAFGGRAPRGPAGGATALPQTP